MGKEKKRIILGFSGGANSIVAASLLNSQDYDVRCVHFHVDPKVRAPLCGCIVPRTLGEIEKLGQKLGINLKIEDRTDAYAELVVEPLLHQRLVGRHDEICLNYHQSFLLDGLEAYRKKTGATNLATGHKLRVVQDQIAKSTQVIRSFETDLDQSAYFARVPLDVLGRLVLPMGEIPSSMVEKIVRELKLPHTISSPARHSSHDCMPSDFWKGSVIPSIVPKDLFKPGSFKARPDPIATEHPGIFSHHIGEALSGYTDKYAAEPDFEKRLWHVDTADGLARTLFALHHAHWLIPIRALENTKVEIRRLTDSNHETRVQGSVFHYMRDWIQVQTDQPLRAVSPGESFVFYQGEALVGSARVVVAAQHGGTMVT